MTVGLSSCAEPFHCISVEEWEQLVEVNADLHDDISEKNLQQFLPDQSLLCYDSIRTPQGQVSAPASCIEVGPFPPSDLRKLPTIAVQSTPPQSNDLFSSPIDSTLPAEVLTRVLSHLTSVQDFANAARVSKHWRQLASAAQPSDFKEQYLAARDAQRRWLDHSGGATPQRLRVKVELGMNLELEVSPMVSWAICLAPMVRGLGRGLDHLQLGGPVRVLTGAMLGTVYVAGAAAAAGLAIGRPSFRASFHRVPVRT